MAKPMILPAMLPSFPSWMGTGIDQNDIRLLDLVGIDIALLLHDRNDDFRIADVHLTAVCFDKKFTARTLQRTQSIYLLVIHSCKTGLAR